jgi:BirA family biotin operon repressor/biotin-[acetyl-CoA-carboxylase] ligase
VKNIDKRLIETLRLLRLNSAQKDSTLHLQKIPYQTLQELKDFGFALSHSTGSGWRLVKDSDALFPENIISHRLPIYDTKPVYVFQETSSTMDLASRSIDLANSDIATLHGTIWVANSQSAGRGRMKRYWHSPPGKGCWFTVAVSTDALETPSVLPFAAGLAVHFTLLKLYGLETELKWPNDILFNGKKLCGILVEKPYKQTIHLVGIGINVFQQQSDFPEQIRHKSTSLAQTTFDKTTQLNRCKIIATVSDSLLEISQLPWSEIRSNWCSKCSYFQNSVVFQNGSLLQYGIFHDIDSTGALILRDDLGNLSTHLSGDLRPAITAKNVAY